MEATTMRPNGMTRTQTIVIPAPGATERSATERAADWTILTTGPVGVDTPASRTTPAAGQHPTTGETTDRALIAASRAGDLDAFNTIVTRYERAVYNTALRIMRDPAAAEDATQDALIKAWTAIGTFNGEVLLPWLIRIVTNRCYDLIRSRNRRPADSLDQEELHESSSWSAPVAPTESPAAFAERSEGSGRIRAALDQLNADQRTVVILSDVHGYAYEEIAETLGVAVGTVKSRLCRGRARLRELLCDEVRPATR
ncbi:MAG TPA: sigma-70 family RNA polymerase sigma factor [Thermomicrobiales bacterium]|nr:sigma-70 family RNA polymerase sigma factor [Thermomicrobiales bacterium]